MSKETVTHDQELFKKKLIDGLRGHRQFREEVLDLLYDMFVALNRGNFNTMSVIQNISQIERKKGYKNSITDLRKVKFKIMDILKQSEKKITEDYDVDIDQKEYEDSDHIDMDTEPDKKEKEIKAKDLTMDMITVSDRKDSETTGYYADTDSSENFFPHAEGLFEYTKKLGAACPVCGGKNVFRTISQEYGECKDCDKIVDVDKMAK